MRTFVTFKFLVFVIFFFNTCEPSFQSLLAGASDRLPEDGRLNFTELSVKYGHPAKEYNVVTEDGYILSIFRMPGRKPPVLLLHGQADTGDSFIIRGRASLAITLAEAGYDVWTGNSRGNKYSRRHIKLDPDSDSEYWNYSFHEIGYYDLAAMIDCVCNETGRSAVAVIGHSQGGTAQLVLTSTRPEYNAKIKVGVMLAPGVFFKHAVFPLSGSAKIGPKLNSILPENIRSLFGDGNSLTNIIRLACSQGFVSWICLYVFIFPFTGFNHFGLSPKFLRIGIGHYPAAVSRKGLLHFDQALIRKRFSQFDYGPEKNMKLYGKPEPPDYNLTAVTAPTALFVGRNDAMVRVKDILDLKEVLPNVVHIEVMLPMMWNHLDFVWGAQMPKYLFPSIFKILKEYSA